MTDLFSFYCLGSSVIGNSKIGRINAAYLYYNIATTITFKKLMERGLQFALDAQCDVFNALDMMNNQEVFKVRFLLVFRMIFRIDLKFGEGDGSLHYYLYNWRLPQVSRAFLNAFSRFTAETVRHWHSDALISRLRRGAGHDTLRRNVSFLVSYAV